MYYVFLQASKHFPIQDIGFKTYWTVNRKGERPLNGFSREEVGTAVFDGKLLCVVVQGKERVGRMEAFPILPVAAFHFSVAEGTDSSFPITPHKLSGQRGAGAGRPGTPQFRPSAFRRKGTSGSCCIPSRPGIPIFLPSFYPGLPACPSPQASTSKRVYSFSSS